MSVHLKSARQWRVLVVASAVVAGGWSLLAQGGPAPARGDGAGGRGAAAMGDAARQGGPAGRGGRAGGGPGRDDPINADVDYSKQPTLQPQTPADEAKQFILQPGYRLELVLADPVIQDPTAIAFDGDGRMFVLEDRGYMQDADARGELDPVGRISLHVDTDGDGVYDKHTVFVDHLVFPRFLTPFGPNAILTKESNADEVWKYTDTDGDGVADKKELFDTGYGRTGNIEHQEAFLTWAMDNWMYSTYNAFRARWTPHGVIKETTGSNGAQWGVSQDNDGKLWFQGGASGVPSYWQFPIVYGNFSVPDQMEPDFRIPWGAPIRVADMQGGMAVIRMPDGSLKSTTAGAGGDVFRGDRLPADLIGDYFYGEEVARIVRRVHPENREGLTIIHNAYPNSEFLKALDPYFRPVDQTTAPDGTMYITDMYHGIIQESQWTPQGSYLRAKIEQYDLDKVIHHGRIWRLVYDGVKADRSDALTRDRTMPHMNGEMAAQLVAHLSHPNGWWRDTAQQLLVLKQDRSVVPALTTIVESNPNLLARFHALWTLEGLDALDPALVRREMKDPEPRMRIQAIRASETLYKAGDASFADDYRAMTKDSNVDVVIQAMLTINRWKVPGAEDTLKATADANKARGVQVVAGTILNPTAFATGRRGGGRGAAPAMSAAETALMTRGSQIYGELCFSCHGTNGLGAPRPEIGPGATMAPPLAGSPRVNGHRDYVINAILFGLTGPVGGKSYDEVMIPMQENDDAWVAAVASYVRQSFGNDAGFVTPADVARVRASESGRKTSWVATELAASVPTLLVRDGWTATASHNSAAARGALSLTSWSSDAPQATGMWFQVELPQPATITEIQFESPAPAGGRGGRGARGGGAPTAAPAPIPAPASPRAYTVAVSTDGQTWTDVAHGTGAGDATVASFAPTRAKFVRLTLTASDASVWTIRNLRLYASRAGAQ
jgi:mono/diheme cytochrome c family protein